MTPELTDCIITVIGQYPDTFTAASLHNPVMSCSEVSTSDIRDWFWAEFGRDYPIQSSEVGSDGCSIPVVKSVGVMTPELYGVLFKASPIAYVEKVKAAVLLCIGGSDKRVAPTQGIDYYHALKAVRAKGKNGLKSDNDDGVEMLWFQEDEAFTTVAPVIVIFPKTLLASSAVALSQDPSISFECVIVRGGTAGLTVAVRLSENPNVKVAVIEAGGIGSTE
ncbi:acylamino-acid-releasing enzyme [Moniliophthora roreri]|nr:acylamino-acid-releasing enzyme [Moniliophthora roreri]